MLSGLPPSDALVTHPNPRSRFFFFNFVESFANARRDPTRAGGFDPDWTLQLTVAHAARAQMVFIVAACVFVARRAEDK